MPLKGFRLTRLCATSKLFFAASQRLLKRIYQCWLWTASARGIGILIHMINQSSRCSICLLLVALLSARISAQSPPEPVREQLLNGLTILFWQRPDANVLLKLRVHSGAAFDLAGKGGTMALLGDAIFPDPSTREYVEAQLAGKLQVTTIYDATDLTISSK